MSNKILFITHYTSLYGANKSLLNLLEELDNFQFEVMVVLPQRGELCEILENKNIPFKIHAFNCWCGTVYIKPIRNLDSFINHLKFQRQNKKKLLFNLKQLKNLNESLGDFKPNFVYSNSSVFNFGLLYAKKYNIPHIWHLRESQEQYDLNWFYKRKYIIKNFKESNIVICVSNFLKEYYNRNYNVENINVLYNGVLKKDDLFKLDELQKFKLPEKAEALVFGIIGLIHPKKGQIEAVKAFAKVNKIYPATKLLIVGGGNQLSLKQYIDNSNINSNNIELWGYISDPFLAFNKMNVALMCSKMEGMGRVTVEAMAAGIPVIGRKEGGTVELIRENENGLFYENDYKDLAEKMLFLIRNNKLRTDMGLKAREIFKKNYTTEIYVQNFLNIINKHEISNSYNSK